MMSHTSPVEQPFTTTRYPLLYQSLEWHPTWHKGIPNPRSIYTSHFNLFSPTCTATPSYSNTGPRQYQGIQTRLRTQCSSLNVHLFSKNIVVSPLWQCGIVETTSHYLLHRPLYIAHRDVMLDFRLITADSTITNITTKLLLYTLSLDKKGDLLQSVRIH